MATSKSTQTLDMALLIHYTKMIRAHGWPVYEHVPAKGVAVSYPFVVIGDITVTTSGDKSRMAGTCSLTLDVWGELADRGDVSRIARGLLTASVGNVNAEGYRLLGRAENQQIDYSTDTSDQAATNSVFSRAMLTLNLEIL